MQAKNVGCFDCLKTGNVKVTLPGGAELDIVCPRCNGNKFYYVLSPSPGEFNENTGEFKFPSYLAPEVTKSSESKIYILFILIFSIIFLILALIKTWQ